MATVGELSLRWLEAQRRLAAFGEQRAVLKVELDSIATAAGPLIGPWLRTHSLYLTRFVGADTIMTLLKSSKAPAPGADEKLIALERDVSAGTKRQEELDAELAKLLSAPVQTRGMQRRIDEVAAQFASIRKRLNDLEELHRKVSETQMKPFPAFCDYLRKKVMLTKKDRVFIWMSLNENDISVFPLSPKDLKNWNEQLGKITDGGKRILAIVLKTSTVVTGNDMGSDRFFTVFPLLKSVLLNLNVPPSQLIGQQIWKINNENIDPDWWALLTASSESQGDASITAYDSSGNPNKLLLQRGELAGPDTDISDQFSGQKIFRSASFNESTAFAPISRVIGSLFNSKQVLVQEYRVNAYIAPLIVTEQARIAKISQLEAEEKKMPNEDFDVGLKHKPVLLKAVELAGQRLKGDRGEHIFFLWVMAETGPKTPPEAMPLIMSSRNYTAFPTFIVKQPYWSGASSYPCMQVAISMNEREDESSAEYLEPFRSVINQYIIPSAASTPRTGIFGEVEYIAGDGGCAKMVLTEGVSVGAVFVNLAKALGSLYDVDKMELTDASSVPCGKSAWLPPSSISLKLVNTMKEGLPWYSARFGFVPTSNAAEGIRFIQQVLMKKSWATVRDALMQVVAEKGKRSEIVKSRRQILHLYALDAVNCCLPTPECKGLDEACKASQPATNVLVGAARGNLCELVSEAADILYSRENVEQFLAEIPGLDPSTFDAVGIARFMGNGIHLTWFRRPPNLPAHSPPQLRFGGGPSPTLFGSQQQIRFRCRLK